MRRFNVVDFFSSPHLRERVETHLQRGGAVIFPTDSLYGIGVDPGKDKALDTLFQLKEREEGKSFPLLVSEEAVVPQVFESVNPTVRRLMECFWPGKLTIVSRMKEKSYVKSISRDKTIGLRLPDSYISRELARLCGGMITGTSANKRSGEFPRNPDDILSDFSDDNVWVLEGGSLPPSRGSTVVRVSGDEVKIIREGDIPEAEILFALEEC